MQITKLESISQENIIFDKARDFKVKESKFKYQRIKYQNGKEARSANFLFSFGVNESLGYSIPVCLWEKDSQQNQDEKPFFDSINNIPQICQFYLEEEYGQHMASCPFY